MYRDSLNADGSSATLDSLKAQLVKAQSDLSYAQGMLSKTQAARASCQRTGLLRTWDNSCLDANTAAARRYSTDIDNANSTISRLRGEIAAEEASLAKAAQITRAANPVLAKIDADAALKAQDIASKKPLIIGAVILIVLIGIGTAFYFIKKSKGK